MVLPHLPSAYNLARWLTRNGSDADDVVQEAFLRAYRFFPSFRGTDARAWVLAIVRNSCWTFLRATARGRSSPTSTGRRAAGRAPSPRRTSSGRRTGRGSRALEELPAGSREPSCSGSSKSSYLQIAEVAHSVRTVMSRLAQPAPAAQALARPAAARCRRELRDRSRARPRVAGPELSVEAALEAGGTRRSAQNAPRHTRAASLCARLCAARISGGASGVARRACQGRLARKAARLVPRSSAWAAAAAPRSSSGRRSVFLSPLREAIRARGLDETLVTAHVQALAAGRVVEVVSSDQHTVKPWFAGKIDFSPKVKDLAGDGFPLKGGRLDRVGGRPAAALAYGRARHAIDLFVWVVPAAARGVSTVTVRGINVVRWTEGDLAYAAVSDLNESELLAFADLVRR